MTELIQKKVIGYEMIPLTTAEYPYFEDILFAIGEDELNGLSSYYVIGVITDGYGVGQITVKIQGTTLFIVDLYVRMEYRRNGIGSDLLDEVMEAAYKFGYEVEALFLSDGADQKYAFFESCGDLQIEKGEGYLCSIPVKEYLAIEQFADVKGREGVKKYSSCEPEEKSDFQEKLSGISMGDYLETQEDQLIDELSLCVSEKRRITTAVLFEEYGEGDLLMALAYMEPNKYAQFLAVLEQIRQLLLKREDREYRIHMACINNSAVRLVEKMFPGRQEEAAYYVAHLSRVQEGDSNG